MGEEPADWTGPSWPDLQFGHLWFVENLLACCVLYAVCRRAARPLPRRAASARRRDTVPGHGHLALLVVALAAATFAVRLRYPLDTWVPFLDFLQVEPARTRSTPRSSPSACWPAAETGRAGSRPGGLDLAVSGAAGTGPLFVVGAGARCFGPGGANGPSLLWSCYESVLCVALCVGLLVLFRETCARAGGCPVPQRRTRTRCTSCTYRSSSPSSSRWPGGLAAARRLRRGRGGGRFVTFPLAALVRRLPGFRRVL
ncbi:hypothetical protein NKH77_50165 [Streptomyces sp. M19]